MSKNTVHRCDNSRLASSLFKQQSNERYFLHNRPFNAEPRIFSQGLKKSLSQEFPPELIETQDTRSALRRRLRQRRRSLSRNAQRKAALHLSRHLLTDISLIGSRHIALYLASDGEIDLSPLISPLDKRGIKLYLPVLRPFVHNRLWFVRVTPKTKLVRNRFGIWEPDTRYAALSKRRLPAWGLDKILMPLVGFDSHGGRLGMGGGFYDRSLSFISRKVGPRPKLIGIAYACQQVTKLNVEKWDIPLDGVLTNHCWRKGKILSTHQ